MIVPRIKVVLASVKTEKELAWGAKLTATAPSGETRTMEITRQVQLPINKNQLDFMAIALALQCIKPPYRSQAEVQVCLRSYLLPYFSKDTNGLWRIIPKANAEYIGHARRQVDKYTHISFAAADDVEIDKVVGVTKACITRVRQAANTAEVMQIIDTPEGPEQGQDVEHA